MSNIFQNLSVTVLKRALNIQEQIEALGSEMHQLLTGSDLPAPLKAMDKQRRKMSAAARRLMSEAQKARWAKRKGETVAEQPVKQVRRKMSAAGRAKIAAAARERWAKAKAAGKSRL